MGEKYLSPKWTKKRQKQRKREEKTGKVGQKRQSENGGPFLFCGEETLNWGCCLNGTKFSYTSRGAEKIGGVQGRVEKDKPKAAVWANGV